MDKLTLGQKVMSMLPASTPQAPEAPLAKPAKVPQKVYTCRFWQLPGAATTCPVCRQNGLTHAARYPVDDAESLFFDALVYWCSVCGSGHVPDATRFIANYYARTYASSNRKDRDVAPAEYFSDAMREKSPRLQRYFNRATAQAALLRSHGGLLEKTLDYGSGPGYFLHTAQARQKYAVEPDENSSKYLQYLGAMIVQPPLPKETFDTICASHSIEHLDAVHLDDRLSDIAQSLIKGGVFLAEVPTGALSYLSLVGGHEPHTIFFSPQGFRSSLERTGLKLLTCVSRSKPAAERHPQPIYTPEPTDAFASVRTGALTIVARRET